MKFAEIEARPFRRARSRRPKMKGGFCRTTSRAMRVRLFLRLRGASSISTSDVDRAIRRRSWTTRVLSRALAPAIAVVVDRVGRDRPCGRADGSGRRCRSLRTSPSPCSSMRVALISSRASVLAVEALAVEPVSVMRLQFRERSPALKIVPSFTVIAICDDRRRRRSHFGELVLRVDERMLRPLRARLRVDADDRPRQRRPERRRDRVQDRIEEEHRGKQQEGRDSGAVPHDEAREAQRQRIRLVGRRRFGHAAGCLSRRARTSRRRACGRARSGLGVGGGLGGAKGGGRSGSAARFVGSG